MAREGKYHKNVLYVLPRISFYMQMLPIPLPRTFFTQLSNLLTSVIWNSRKPHIALKVLKHQTAPVVWEFQIYQVSLSHSASEDSELIYPCPVKTLGTYGKIYGWEKHSICPVAFAGAQGIVGGHVPLDDPCT